MVWLLCGFANFAFAQTQSSDRTIAQSRASLGSISVKSKLVVVRTVVLDKKHLDRGMTQSERQCSDSDWENFFKLPPTQPYLQKYCEVLDVRDLTAAEFHILVDGREQKIQALTTEGEYMVVRDNLGYHDEYSETPAAIWGASDHVGMSSQSELVRFSHGATLNQVYDLAFVPNDPEPAGCHSIAVKVDRQHSVVRARNEYCNSQSPFDTLSGTNLGKLMEHFLNSGESGNIDLSLRTGSFSTGAQKARVQVALEFSPDVLHSQWEKDWALHATIGVLGMLYKEDGDFAMRFSDLGCCSSSSTSGIDVSFQGTRKLNFDSLSHLDAEFGLPYNPVSAYLSRVAKAFLPTRYETQLELAPGQYDLHVVLSDGERFGHARAHLNIDSYDGKNLSLSSVMVCKRYRDAHVAAVETAAANIAPRYVPMVSKGIQVTPAGDTDFKGGEHLIPYFEIYAPQAAGEPITGIQVHLRIVDAKNGEIVKDFPAIDAAPYAQPGSTTIPVAREVPIATLPKGEYRLEVQASDSAGRTTPWRAANFTIADKN